MQHFFVTPGQVDGDVIYIEGSDVNHIKNVLRMRTGEQVQISDGNNRVYYCCIEAFEQNRVTVRIEETKEADTELPSDIYLFQGLPKADKMDMITQKAVELGVHEIIPVATKRSVVKLDEKKAAKKAERWNNISESAAKQAGRSIVPNVRTAVGYKEALKLAENMDVLLIPYELAEGMKETEAVIESIHPGQSIGIFIGPEGGFEKEEVEEAAALKASVITLGKRILRTETAGLAALSVLMYHLECKTS